jgi:hypothetical protein
LCYAIDWKLIFLCFSQPTQKDRGIFVIKISKVDNQKPTYQRTLEFCLRHHLQLGIQGVKNVPVRPLRTRLTNAMSCFEPGFQEPNGDILNTMYVAMGHNRPTEIFCGNQIEEKGVTCHPSYTSWKKDSKPFGR